MILASIWMTAGASNELHAQVELADEAAALCWVNNQLWEWNEAGKLLAAKCAGSWDIDADFADANGDPLAIAKLRHTDGMITANGGEQSFLIAMR